jgi:hypothetical protein
LDGLLLLGHRRRLLRHGRRLLRHLRCLLRHQRGPALNSDTAPAITARHTRGERSSWCEP